MELGGIGRTDEAIAEYKAVIRIKPDFAEAHYNLGEIYVVNKDRTAALAEYGILKGLSAKLAADLFNLIYAPEKKADGGG